MTENANWTQVSKSAVKFPSNIPQEGAIVEENGKKFKIHHIVVDLDAFFTIEGKNYPRYSSFEKGQLLSLPLWGNCLIQDLEVFKIPGNWIRIAKMPVVETKITVSPEWIEPIIVEAIKSDYGHDTYINTVSGDSNE